MSEANVFFTDLTNVLIKKLGDNTKPTIDEAIDEIRRTWHGEEVYITPFTDNNARLAAIRTDITRAMQEIAKQYGITPKHAKALYRGRPRKNA